MALDFGKLDFSTSFNRTSAFPLDAKSYFESLSEAQQAALGAEEAGSTNTSYYFGQVVAIYTPSSGIAEIYKIIKVVDTTEKGYHGELTKLTKISALTTDPDDDTMLVLTTD